MNKKNGANPFNISVVSMWMISFLVLVVFCALTMFFGYRSAEESMEKHLGQVNEVVMSERITNVDQYIGNVINGMLNISNLSEFESVSALANTSDRAQRHMALKFCTAMNQVGIEGVNTALRFVYVPTKNIIIGGGVTRDAQAFFGAAPLEGSYEKWETKLLDRANRNMLYYDEETKMLFLSSKRVN
jgi:hypothetical protein